MRRPPTQADSLIRRLTGHPHLPSYVKQLPASTLNRLIGMVGLEDSQEILASMSPEQLKAVLSVSLWSNARPGREEVLDLEQLLRWIDLWLQEGEQVLVQRVLELGEDFTVMCLSRLLIAVDRTAVGLSQNGLELGQYMIFPKQEKHWHSLVATLMALWHHEPDFVLGMLRRCSFERSILSQDASEHSSASSLYEDIAAQRAAKRAGVGYVDPTHAALFLSIAKTTDLQELIALNAYDVTSASYLDEHQQTVERGHGATVIYSSALDRPGLTEMAEPGPSESGGGQVERNQAALTEDFETLDSLLRDAGILQASANVTPLLTDRCRAPLHSELLEAALGSIARSAPNIASRRVCELAYLSNVLIAGAEIQGKAFSEADAAKVATATANLGVTYLLHTSSRLGDEVGRTRQWLEADPGIVRLFQIGYHLLCTIPRRCCEAIYHAKALQARRPGHVVIQEMNELLGARRLTDLVDDGLYGEAKSLIDGLSAVMDSPACVALRILIDPTPCFPCVLKGGTGSQSIYVDKGYQHISTMEDVEHIATFLRDLARYCGN